MRQMEAERGWMFSLRNTLEEREDVEAIHSNPFRATVVKHRVVISVVTCLVPGVRWIRLMRIEVLEKNKLVVMHEPVMPAVCYVCGG